MTLTWCATGLTLFVTVVPLFSADDDDGEEGEGEGEGEELLANKHTGDAITVLLLLLLLAVMFEMSNGI